MELWHEGRIVDVYAVEFLRHSRFVPTLVAEKSDRACRFQ